MTYSAYVAEVFRAGIESVHECAARGGPLARAVVPARRCASVVLPQAVRRVVPPLMNDLVSLQKDVALISVLGPVEALRRRQIVKDRRRSTSRPTSSPPCCSCACRSR